MELVRLASCVRVVSSGSLLARTQGCSVRWVVSHARSFSANAYRSQAFDPPFNKRDFPSTDGFSPVLDSTTDPTLVSELSTQGGELASLGLGGVSPTGLLQTVLEMVHVNIGLPWWGSIALCTVTLRFAIFPLIINLQKNAIRMNNIRPDMEKLMNQVAAYNNDGNYGMADVELAKVLKLFEKNNCSPMKLFLAPLAQAPIFISFFLAIRGMANAPVESMKTGGMLWFTDLTVTDPYFILPILNAALFMISLEFGGDLGVQTPQMEKMKMILRALAVSTVFVSAFFPTGLFMYWMTSSMFSLGQILVLRQPGLRYRLGIPKAIQHPFPSMGTPPKSDPVPKVRR